MTPLFPRSVRVALAASLGSLALYATVSAAHTWRLDPSFGAHGQVLVPGFGSADCDAVAIQANGRILACGVDSYAGLREATITAYRKNGKPDLSFGTGGKAVLAFPGRNVLMYNAALQKDGKVLVGGSLTHDTTFNEGDALVARFLANGTLDPSFGTGGVVTFAQSQHQVFFSVAAQPDGKIVAAGYGFPNPLFTIVRYQSNGTPDSSFGSGGQVVSGFGIGAGLARTVALQADGKILVAGQAGAGAAVVRLNANGSADTGFGNSGAAAFSVDNASAVAGLGLQADGHILLAGTDESASTFLVRINGDGSQDTTYGTAGFATTTAGHAHFLLVQKDGRAVIGGESGDADGFVQRFTTGGVPDASFAPNGTFTLTRPGGYIGLERGSVQKDGRLVLGGYSYSAPSGSILLQRYGK